MWIRGMWKQWRYVEPKKTEEKEEEEEEEMISMPAKGGHTDILYDQTPDPSAIVSESDRDSRPMPQQIADL